MHKKYGSIACAVLCLSLSAAAQSATITLATGDWPPYTSETDASAKLAEAIVAEAFSLEGISVQFVYYPWKRSYEMALNGDVDGTFPWNRTAERCSDFYIHDKPMFPDEAVYFHLKSTPFDWTDKSDLKKWRVGVTLGYKQEAEYKDLGILADSATSDVLNFKKLLNGRIDVFQTSKIVGFDLIRRTFSSEDAAKFTCHPKIVDIDAYYVMFSRKTSYGKYYMERFNAGLSSLESSGRLDALIKAFLPPE